MKARAYAALEAGKDWETWEYEIPAELEPDQVEIRVTHCGLCHSDLHMQDNAWKMSTFPLVAGHEIVGVISRVGENVQNLDRDTRVGVGWIRDSCGQCAPCLRGEENLCRLGYEGTILNRHRGGFQEFVRVPSHWAIKIPDGVPSEEAAPLLCAGATVYAPLRHVLSKYPERPASVGVIGIGGVGHLAVQFAAKSFGAEVTAFSPIESQRQDCFDMGAKHFFSVNHKELLRELKGTFDVLVNAAPVELDWGLYLSLLKKGGVLIMLGIPSNQMTIPLQDLVFGQKTITGSIVSGRRLIQEMLGCALAHQVKPMIEVFSLRDINTASKKVRSGEVQFKAVLAVQDMFADK